MLTRRPSQHGEEAPTHQSRGIAMPYALRSICHISTGVEVGMHAVYMRDNPAAVRAVQVVKEHVQQRGVTC